MVKIILLVTSHCDMGKTGKKTGWYLPEVAHPWEIFEKHKYDITIASPKGGLVSADPGSITDWAKDECCQKFSKQLLNEKNELKTVKMSTLTAKDYDVIFYAGGHGTMWDFPDDEVNHKAAQTIYENGGIVSAVCHGPAALVNIKLSNGEYLVKGKSVTGFTNDEETAVKLEKVMPFLLESKLKERGAKFASKANWKGNCVVDERLVTGQNPASAGLCANAIVKLLNKKKYIITDDDLKVSEEVKQTRIKESCHKYSDNIRDVLLTGEEIQNRIVELGKEITDYYSKLKDGKEIVVVGLLRGAFIFVSDMCREIKVKHAVDFMMVKSYAGVKSTNVKILLDMNIDPGDKHVLIVEDLVDTGKTLMWLEKHFEMKKAASVKKCILLQKKTKRLHSDFDVKLDFVGFQIPDHWICGYGMDYNQYYRSLPAVCILKEEVYSKKE